MISTYCWRVFLLLSLSSIVYARTCKWHIRNQEEWTRQILHNLNQMVPAEKTDQNCLENTTHLPVIDSLYNIIQVESAVLAVREVANQTIQFLKNNQEKLDYHRLTWERLQELAHYQQQQELYGCILKGIENQLFIHGIRQRFKTLQRILDEHEDETCAQRTAHAEIQRNLLLAGQLSSRMRRQHIQSSLL